MIEFSRFFFATLFSVTAYMDYDNNTNKVMMTKRSHLLHLRAIQEQVTLIRFCLSMARFHCFLVDNRNFGVSTLAFF